MTNSSDGKYRAFPQTNQPWRDRKFPQPGLCMNYRYETAEMAVLPGNRRDEDPRRTH